MDCGDDGAGLGDGEGVDVVEVAKADLCAHFLFLLNGGLWTGDESRGLEDGLLEGLVVGVGAISGAFFHVGRGRESICGWWRMCGGCVGMVVMG